ncbi:MAG: hypothetical protein IKX30_10955 [Victivallales bacterium]|nr:hypothetical protein [Victivallales bacterium]
MTFKTIILALIFVLFATGCTSVSAKKKALFATNRLFTVGYSFGTEDSETDSFEDKEIDESSLHKSCLLLAVLGLEGTGKPTCYNVAMSPLFCGSSHDVIHGFCVAPLAGWKRINGVQVALQGLAEKGHGIQVAGILCATASWDGLMLAPVCLCMDQNNSVQVGFIALTSVLSGQYRASPAMGQLSFINYTMAKYSRKGFHWQAAGWNNYYSEIEKDGQCHLLQFGLCNMNWTEFYKDFWNEQKDKQQFKCSEQIQLGLWNWGGGDVASKTVKVQCGIVNKLKSRHAFMEDGFCLQFGFFNRSEFEEEDQTMQIGLVNRKGDKWRVLFCK